MGQSIESRGPEYRDPQVGAVTNSEHGCEIGGLDIGALLFVCPTTRALIDSGIDSDRRTASSVAEFRVRVHCAACGCSHEFAIGSGQLGPFKHGERGDAERASAFFAAAPGRDELVAA